MSDTQKKCAVAAAHFHSFQNPNESNFSVAWAKAEATIFAQLALAGHAVHRTTDGGYIVSRWDRSLHCPDFAALADFAKRVGGA